jgi:hypothetical protein
LHTHIIKVATKELSLARAELANIQSTLLLKTRKICLKIHNESTTEADINLVSFDQKCNILGEKSYAATTAGICTHEINTAFIKLKNELHFEDTYAEERKASQQVRFAAAMEVENQMTEQEKIDALVKTAVDKELGKLKKQMNTKKSALNTKASGPGQTTGKNHAQPKKNPVKANAKAVAGGKNNRSKASSSQRKNVEKTKQHKPKQKKN